MWMEFIDRVREKAAIRSGTALVKIRVRATPQDSSQTRKASATHFQQQKNGERVARKSFYFFSSFFQAVYYIIY